MGLLGVRLKCDIPLGLVDVERLLAHLPKHWLYILGCRHNGLLIKHLGLISVSFYIIFGTFCLQ